MDTKTARVGDKDLLFKSVPSKKKPRKSTEGGQIRNNRRRIFCLG